MLTVSALIVAAVLAGGCGSTIRQSGPTPEPTFASSPAPHLSTAARVAIDRTLDQFVLLGVERQDPARAYDLVTPSMRYQQTREQWAHGALPVPPFQARGSTFHDYSLTYATPTQATLQMILHARHPARDGSVAYDVQLRRIHGRWLVDWFTPTAFFAPSSTTPGITAEPDLSPSADASDLQSKAHADTVFWVVLGLLGVPFAIGLAAVAVHMSRDRKPQEAPAADDEMWADALRRNRR